MPILVGHLYIQAARIRCLSIMAHHAGRPTGLASMPPRTTLQERNQRVIRMKDELIKVLDLVSRCRQSIEDEVSDGLAAKMKSVDVDFLRRLKELSVIFNNMTDARIRLDKAEKQLENDLTPAEEQQGVVEYIKALPNQERGTFLRSRINEHLETINETGRLEAKKFGSVFKLNQADALLASASGDLDAG